MQIVNSIIVGNGLSGINVAIDLLKNGDRDFLIIDRAVGFGGTWRDNTYPGAECDIQSHLYSYSFEPNPYWSKTYAPQPEILEYINGVAEKWGLSKHVKYNSELLEAAFDENLSVWRVETAASVYWCRNLVLCTGHLADPKEPDASGISKFEGKHFHSARWDHSYDLSGKRIGVIGTGASAIQIVPALAREGHNLTVFQRSAPYVIPRKDEKYTEDFRRTLARSPEMIQDLRQFLFWSNESRFLQRLLVEEELDKINSLATEHRERALCGFSELLKKVTPDYIIGCKRILLSNTWYPTLTLRNVKLVDSAVKQFTKLGLVDANGNEYKFDVIISCSGFEAQKLPIANRIKNSDGLILAEYWNDGSRAYGGMMVKGFPNLFMSNGPHVGLGAGSILSMIEIQAEFIAKTINQLKISGHEKVEVTSAAEDCFIDLIERRSQGTVWTSGGCKSWYTDGATGKLTAIWPDMVNRYRSMFREPRYSDLTFI